MQLNIKSSIVELNYNKINGNGTRVRFVVSLYMFYVITSLIESKK